MIIGSLIAQTRSTGPQVHLVTRDGVVLLTENGYKSVFPRPGFAYYKDYPGSQAQLLDTYCSWNHQVNELLARQPDGLYKFRIYPNPASVAVFKNGIRLTPDKHFKLVWTIPNNLPTSVDVFGSSPEDDVIVDYFIGASITVP